MKNRFIIALAIMVIMSLFSAKAIATEDIGEGEKDLPRVVYGEALSESQQDEVRRLLDITDREMVKEYTVTSADLVQYIGATSGLSMYSSAIITIKNEGHGIVINIVTPENITQVTSEMYTNALLTAGVENADVIIASPVKVSGRSALTGIYKAFNVDGESLDQDRMKVANEELELVTELASQEDIDEETITELLAEIKQQLAEQNPVSREEVEQIVAEQLERLNIELSAEDFQRLVDLFDKMRSLGIDFGQVSEQLQNITKSIQDKLQEVSGDNGFWEVIKNFFARIIYAIQNLTS